MVDKNYEKMIADLIEGKNEKEAVGALIVAFLNDVNRIAVSLEALAKSAETLDKKFES